MITVPNLQDYNYSNVQAKKEGDNKKVASVSPIFKEMKDKEAEKSKKAKTKKDDEKEDSSSQIIVKPDGSRVLIITTKVGGMETNMSIKISEPTYMPNDSEYLNEEEFTETVADDM